MKRFKSIIAFVMMFTLLLSNVMSVGVLADNSDGGNGATSEPEVVTISPEVNSILVGEQITLTATISPQSEDNQDMYWGVLDSSVISIVTTEGNTCTIKGESAGTTRISVMTNNGYAEVEVTVEEAAENEITVHFHNKDNWSQVYMRYNGMEGASNSWTNKVMTSDGNGWYSCTVSGHEQIQVVFHNGEGQQIPAAGQSEFIVASEKWYVNGKWYTEEPAQVTVHYYNSTGWNQPYMYYYYGEDLGPQWPGVSMTAEGDGWYTYTVIGYDQIRVLFNNNAGQQIPGEKEEGYLIKGEQWFVDGQLFNQKPKGITVHYYNSNNWNQPYMYYYYGEKTGPQWPGTKMVSEGDGWYKCTVYGYTQVRVLFSNNGGEQVPAVGQDGYLVTGEKWFANGLPYGQKPTGITVHYYNSNNWSQPYIYYYFGEVTGPQWPGSKMISEGDGWYIYTIFNFTEAKVLFNNNAGQQIPAQGQEGYTVTGEKWFKNGVLTPAKPK